MMMQCKYFSQNVFVFIIVKFEINKKMKSVFVVNVGPSFKYEKVKKPLVYMFVFMF